MRLRLSLIDSDANNTTPAEQTHVRTKIVALVVDDNEIIRALLRDMLECLAVKVLEAGTAEHALEALSAQQVDVVVCDYSMPKVSGLELLKQIRSCAPRVRRVLYSGYSESHLDPLALGEAQPELILEKGTSMRHLANVLGALLDDVRRS